MSRTLTDEIREAIDGCGMSRYRLCQELGIPQSTLSRFMNRKAGLAMATLDRIAALLDLHLAVPRKRPRRPS